MVATGVAVVGAVWRAKRRPASFEGQSVLITGGSRGLGLILARLFAREGARVAILGRDRLSLLDAEQELRALGADVDAFVCDVTDRADAEAAIDRIIARWGRIDVLVNNAGIILTGPFEHMQVEDFERQMATHFWAPLHLMRAALPHMRRQGGARIVNIASIGGKVAVPHLAAYCASKSALVGLSDTLRAELAKDRIAVTTVCPGLMRTGSHINAQFKGHHRAEYAWFAAGASPLTSVDAEDSGRAIVEATRRRRRMLIISPQAKLMTWLNALAPELFGALESVASRLLPGVAGPAGNEQKSGRESQTKWLPSMVTRQADEASRRHNQRSPSVPESSVH